ncbi:hypothetical protein AB0H63_20080 [Micromonospora echinospora]|uniref:hypothetical protein n=1 Tax=Micromonospora echinospora TaxID=1877 RepID=UPI0033C947D8
MTGRFVADRLPPLDHQPLSHLSRRQIAFAGLLSRVPGLSVAAPPDSPEWRPGLLIRGLRTRPVSPGQPSTR